jgi:hypothetical protein
MSELSYPFDVTSFPQAYSPFRLENQDQTYDTDV